MTTMLSRLNVLVCLVFALSVLESPSAWAESCERETSAECQKKRRSKKKRRRRRKKAEPSDSDEAAALEAAVEEEPLEEGGGVRRKVSKLTPGQASRWSNQGAMEPIESVVPVRAELPDRNKPKPTGVETPGQDLVDTANQFSTHVSIYASHLETVRQDNDIDLLRAQAQFDYDRIAGTELGVHAELAYWPKLSENTLRPTTYRINNLNVSYGYRDFRRDVGPRFGVALGRVMVPEAGFAIADGGLFKMRFARGIQAGVFGGFAPNPYRFNWARAQTEELSLDYITGGAFGTFQFGRIYADVAAVGYYANNVLAQIPDPDNPGENLFVPRSGLDRFYAFFDFGWAITDELNLFTNGWVDFASAAVMPTNQIIQNIQLVLNWEPTRKWDFRLSGGRFATVVYGESVVGTFGPIAPNLQEPVVVDENGNPIAPFDGALQRAIYNSIRFRAGYEILPVLDTYVMVDTFLRDTADASPFAPFSTLRLVPRLGLRFSDPDLLDASLKGSIIIDEQATNDFILHASIGRGWHGLRADIDGRAIFGDINAYDGGVGLSYTLPRSWFPGRLMLRSMFRYFRENIALERPIDQELLGPEDVLPFVPVQESFYGFIGIDYRL